MDSWTKARRGTSRKTGVWSGQEMFGPGLAWGQERQSGVCRLEMAGDGGAGNGSDADED